MNPVGNTEFNKLEKFRYEFPVSKIAGEKSVNEFIIEDKGWALERE